MTGPLLTIGIPTYNEQKFLRKTLESIRDQSFKDYVAYICDDCSTDDTLKIANEFAASDSRFKVWPSDKKTTFTENWGRSLLKCESEYFVWIGAHDILHKDYFKEAIDILKSDSTVVLVYPKSLALDIDDKVGEPMDSDIETNGDPGSSAMKLASTLMYCTAIHGVFRASVLKALPLRRIIGFDFLMLLLTSVYGKIIATNNVMFYRRVVRQESSAEAVARWKKSGMFEETKYDPFVELVSICGREFYKRFRGPLPKKLKFTQALLRRLSAKFGLPLRDVMKCLLFG